MKTVLLAFTAGAGIGQATTMLAEVEPLSGGAGWAGAGLLSLVLAWVFAKQIPDERKHFKDMLTAKDAQITALIESRDRLAEKMSANTREAVALISSDNKESIKAVIEATERRHAENLEGQRLERAERLQQFGALEDDAKEFRHAVKGLDQTMTNWLTVLELRKRDKEGPAT